MTQTTIKRLAYKPKYAVVLEHLRERIISGNYKVGDALPSQLDLTKKYNVALGTIRQSLGALANEGWIRAEPGRGFFVQLPSKQIAEEKPAKNLRIGFVWWYDILNEPITRSYVCIMHGAAEEAKKHNAEMVYAQFNPYSEQENVRLAQFVKQFDSTIITGKVDAAMLYDIVGPDSNVVIAGETLKEASKEYFSNFDADIESAGYLAVQHLLSFGHKKLALVNETGSLHFFGIQKGCELACRECLLPAPKVFIVNDVMHEMDVPQKVNEAAEKLAEDSEVTGIVVAGYVNAETLIYRLINCGCSVPKDKSVVSICGLSNGKIGTKNFSQIITPVSQMGAECVKFLLAGEKRIIHKSLPVRIQNGDTVSSLNQSSECVVK